VAYGFFPTPLPAARLAVEGLAQMAKALNELSRPFRSGS
jgi:hypothetical protein